MIPATRNLLVFSAALVSVISGAGAQENQSKKTQVKPTNPVSGAEMFKQYCAVCHGPGGKGDGPVAIAFKMPPLDLTTLAQRHDGKFPDDYVSRLTAPGRCPAGGRSLKR